MRERGRLGRLEKGRHERRSWFHDGVLGGDFIGDDARAAILKRQEIHRSIVSLRPQIVAYN
jgi:hypothetical protein